MKINILNIPDSGLDLHFSLESEFLRGGIAGAGGDCYMIKAIDVSGRLGKLDRGFLFSGRVDARLETDCSRCLEVTPLSLNGEFRYTLLPETPPGRGEGELKEEDLDVALYAGEVIDLAPLVVEQIMLQIPMKVLCGPFCRGLCPSCGSNLNEEPCNCPALYPEEPFAALKNFKIQRN